MTLEEYLDHVVAETAGYARLLAALSSFSTYFVTWSAELHKHCLSMKTFTAFSQLPSAKVVYRTDLLRKSVASSLVEGDKFLYEHPFNNTFSSWTSNSKPMLALMKERFALLDKDVQANVEPCFFSTVLKPTDVVWHPGMKKTMEEACSYLKSLGTAKARKLADTFDLVADSVILKEAEYILQPRAPIRATMQKKFSKGNRVSAYSIEAKQRLLADAIGSQATPKIVNIGSAKWPHKVKLVVKLPAPDSDGFTHHVPGYRTPTSGGVTGDLHVSFDGKKGWTFTRTGKNQRTGLPYYEYVTHPDTVRVRVVQDGRATIEK